MLSSPTQRPLASRTRALLAVLFGLVALGVVGMHLLSADHQLAAPGGPGQHHATNLVQSADSSDHDHRTHAAPAETVTTGPAVTVVAAGGHGCAGCDHAMMIGCLLVMVFGLLWRLTARTPGRSWPINNLPRATGLGAAGRSLRTRRAALTHLDLSICRT